MTEFSWNLEEKKATQDDEGSRKVKTCQFVPEFKQHWQQGGDIQMSSFEMTDFFQPYIRAHEIDCYEINFISPHVVWPFF